MNLKCNFLQNGEKLISTACATFTIWTLSRVMLMWNCDITFSKWNRKSPDYPLQLTLERKGDGPNVVTVATGYVPLSMSSKQLWENEKPYVCSFCVINRYSEGKPNVMVQLYDLDWVWNQRIDWLVALCFSSFSSSWLHPVSDSCVQELNTGSFPHLWPHPMQPRNWLQNETFENMNLSKTILCSRCFLSYVII